MKRFVLFLNFALLGAILIGDYFYITNGELVTKATTSILFVIVGAVNLFYTANHEKNLTPFAVYLVSGLFFSMLGDVMLNLSFVSGTALFALGHVCYILSYSKINSFCKTDFAVGGTIFLRVLLFLVLSDIVIFDSVIIKIACVIYSFIISVMLGKSLVNLFKNKSMLTAVIAVGSILFFFSDLMLVFDNFTNTAFPSGTLCLATYYPAQFLLAFSVLTATKSCTR